MFVFWSVGAWERDYNTLLQASGQHPLPLVWFCYYRFLLQNVNIAIVKMGRVTFVHISGIKKKDQNMLIAHGYTLGFRTAKRAKVLGNLLTHLASGGQQPYTKQLNV